MEDEMAKLKKGQTMECIPCAREIVISNAGASSTTLWCCGRPMKEKSKAVAKKKTTSKTAAKKVSKKATKK
jgi:topoisomerase IA-like protein